MKSFLNTLLILTLVLFFADGVLALINALLSLSFGSNVLGGLNFIVFCMSCGLFLGSYCAFGFTRWSPKRWALAVILYFPISNLILIPVWIFFYKQAAWIELLSSLLLLAVCGLCFVKLREGCPARFSCVGEEPLGGQWFSAGRVLGFLAANLLVVLPLGIFYLGFCASVAADQFSAGFLSLRPSGVFLRAKTYERADGKVIRLIPMMHVGESKFYQFVNQSIPADSIVLMEGVSDKENCMKQKLSYQKLAKAIGVAEQKSVKVPEHGKLIYADLDVKDFSEVTRSFLKKVTLFYSQKITLASYLQVSSEAQNPALIRSLLDDLIIKRNQHVVHEIEVALPRWEKIVVPWGAMHMQGISLAIQAEGFRLKSFAEEQSIRFGDLFRHKNPQVSAGLHE